MGARAFLAVLTQPNRSLSLLGVIRHLLHVERHYKWVAAGSVITAPHGEKYILAEHHVFDDYVVLNAIKVTGTATIVEYTEVVHPVTKLKSSRVALPPRQIDVARTPITEDTDGNFKVPKNSYISAEFVDVTATIDGKAITEVTYVLGVYILEAG